jgi:hypothetical protein
MSSAESGELPVVNQPGIPCRHLRTKSMYVFTDGTSQESDDEYDSSAYWCMKTMKDFGPDDDFVSKRDCRSTERTCYEPF